MHLATQPKESAEAHDQRTPAHRIDMRARAVAHQQLFVDVQLHDMHLKQVGADVFSKGTEIVNDALHLKPKSLRPEDCPVPTLVALGFEGCPRTFVGMLAQAFNIRLS